MISFGRMMTATPLAPALRRVRDVLAGWGRNSEGIAAVEFALIAPIVSLLFVGAIEMSQAVTVDRRVMQVATTTADLVARSNASITNSDVTDIMKVGGYIIMPYSQTPLEMTVRNVTSSPTNAATTKQSWYCTFNLNGTGSNSCACSTTAYTLPSGLVSTNDSVVVADVRYFYTPLVFDIIMNRTFTKTGSYYTIKKTSYAKPRSQAAMLQQSNGTSCPPPPFP